MFLSDVDKHILDEEIFERLHNEFSFDHAADHANNDVFKPLSYARSGSTRNVSFFENLILCFPELSDTKSKNDFTECMYILNATTNELTWGHIILEIQACNLLTLSCKLTSKFNQNVYECWFQDINNTTKAETTKFAPYFHELSKFLNLLLKDHH